MSLSMRWANTPHYKQLADKAADRDHFETIGWAMLACGMGPELKAKDTYELWARCQVLSGISEFDMVRQQFAAITIEHIESCVGFTINASRDTRAAWIKRQLDGAIMTHQYKQRNKTAS